MQGSSRGEVLGGSGLLMAAVSSALGARTSIACHVGSDEDGKRISGWLASRNIELLQHPAASPSVRLYELLDDGEGSIVDGDEDPGPLPENLRGVKDLDAVLIGHLSPTTLDRIMPTLCNISKLRVANMSSSVLQGDPKRLIPFLLEVEVLTVSQREMILLQAVTKLDLVKSRRGFTLIGMGADGVQLVESGESRRIKARKVRPSDTLGAGDAMATAFAIGLARGCGPAQAIALAMRVAAVVCQTDDAAEIETRQFLHLL